MFNLIEILDRSNLSFEDIKKICNKINLPVSRVETDLPAKKYKLFLENAINFLTNRLNTLRKKLNNPWRLSTSEQSELFEQDKSISKQFVEFSIALYQFTGSKKLVLTNLNLDSFPERLIDLQNLEILDLSDNFINEIPRNISKLVNLKTLALSNNQISSLPETFIELKNLNKLILNCNNFKDIESNTLPRSLKVLNLSRNKLKEISNEIYNLNELEHLWMCENSISDIEKEGFSYFNDNLKIKALYLFGNSLNKIPIYDWKGNKLNSLRTYFNALNRGTITNYDAKIILVGNGGEGKSTLRKRLCNPLAEIGETSITHDIEIEKWALEDLSTETEALSSYTATMWDFGGQEIKRGIHSFFFTDNALYLLLWSVRQGGEDKYSNLTYWLNSIFTYSPKSKVIIVLNKVFDKNGVIKNDEREYLDQESLMQRYSNIVDFVEISALHNKGIENENGLRRKIRTHVTSLDKVGEELPTSWFNVKKSIVLISKTSPYIDIDEFRELCFNDTEIGLQNEDEFLDIINWLKNIGVILYYSQKTPLNQYLFIDPQWIIKPVYKLLADEGEVIRKNNGKLHSSDLKKICADSREREIIINLMSSFNLCLSVHDQKDEYIVPQLLKEISSNDLKEYSMQDDWDISYEYRFIFQPHGLLNRFIAQCYKENLLKNDLIWNNAIVIMDSDEDTEAIIYTEVLNRNKIIIRIKGNFADNLLSRIRGMLKWKGSEVEPKYRNNENVSEWIACNCDYCRKHKNSTAMYERKIINDMRNKGKSLVQCMKNYEMIKIDNLFSPKHSASNASTSKEDGSTNSVNIFVNQSSEKNVMKGGSNIIASTVKIGDEI